MKHNFASLLPRRGFLSISGVDRREYLQGLISNDINLCQTEKPIYAAFLTPQGKFLHDMFIVCFAESFLIECEAERTEDLLKRLRLHKLRAKIDIENVSSQYSVWALWGEEVPLLPGSFADPRLSALGLRLITGKSTALNTSSLDIDECAFSEYDQHRLKLGIPDGSRDMIIDKSTLLENNMDRLNAVSWSKGCYIGQELTARMHYRALVKKRLYPVTLQGIAPSLGADITLNGDVIGEMRSSLNTAGLALLNVKSAQEAMDKNLEMLCNGTQLIPTEPAWMTL